MTNFEHVKSLLQADCDTNDNQYQNKTNKNCPPVKRVLYILSLLLASLSINAQEPISKVVERGLEFSRNQSRVLAKQLADKQGRLPRTYENGQLLTIDFHHWCCGFFPGVLWQLYGDKPDEELRHYAELFTERCEPAKRLTNTHDLGFMLYCSFGQGYRLTGNPHYLDVIKEGTQSLMTRYNEQLGVIKSWESNKKWKYPVIIDNMMNLEMLCFMTRMTGNQHYMQIAQRHANTTMKNHFRKDYSTYHLVSFDPETGKPHVKQTVQGFADNSSWARGQAWGFYGYTMMYRETHNPKYLKQARRIANFIATHPHLPEDGVPYWDFDAEGIPNALRDASAAAIMACAFIELSQLDRKANAGRWLSVAERQIRTLSTPAYQAEAGTQGGFILKHGVGHLPGKSEVDVPLTYADYYYVEALLRMKKLLAHPTDQ